MSRLPQPSTAETTEWHRQVAFLRRYLQYIPRALSQWPSLQPTAGHRSLPKRSEYDPAEASSFRADVLGPLWSPSARRDGAAAGRTALAAPHTARMSETVSPPTPPTDSGRGYEPYPGSPEGEAPAREGEPRARAAPRTNQQSEPVVHELAPKDGHWMCRACLAQSRALHPPARRCPGYADRIRAAVLDPKGHKLHFSTFSFGEPRLVLACSSYGHYASSNRPCFQQRC